MNRAEETTWVALSTMLAKYQQGTHFISMCMGIVLHFQESRSQQEYGTACSSGLPQEQWPVLPALFFLSPELPCASITGGPQPPVPMCHSASFDYLPMGIIQSSLSPSIFCTDISQVPRSLQSLFVVQSNC